MTRLLAPVGIPIAGAEDRLFHASRLRLIESSALFTVAPGTAPTYSAWVQAIASTAADASVIELVFGTIAANNINSASLYEIGFGGAGSEVTQVAGMLGYGGGGWFIGSTIKLFQVPLWIPKGTRISVRATCATAGRTGTSTMVSTYSPRVQFQTPVAPIALTSAPNGTTCVGSITGTTAYTEVTASCPQPLRGVSVSWGCNGSNNVSQIIPVTLTVGVGAAGAEVTLGTITMGVGLAETALCLSSIVWGDIPRGARIAIKASTSANTFDFHVFGIPYR